MGTLVPSEAGKYLHPSLLVRFCHSGTLSLGPDHAVQAVQAEGWRCHPNSKSQVILVSDHCNSEVARTAANVMLCCCKALLRVWLKTSALVSPERDQCDNRKRFTVRERDTGAGSHRLLT